MICVVYFFCWIYEPFGVLRFTDGPGRILAEQQRVRQKGIEPKNLWIQEGGVKLTHVGRLVGVGVLNLEGLWTRYEDADAVLEEISTLPAEKATRRMQELYGEPVKPELITQRILDINDAGVVSCASVTPQRTEAYLEHILAGELDILVVQGTAAR